MARIKIDYGIDLGTTNSSICRMEKGEPVVIKSDTLKDTLPSCVSINKKGSIKVGDGAYNTMKSDKRRATKSWKKEDSNTYIEFKRTMATDTKYHCANINKDFSSEELSAEVLKTLKSFVTDETFRSVVITVPAKFTVNQKTATIEAAKMAGFDRCELLQEPIAASFAYGLTSEQKNGIWMVFDFGGGTFDAALLRVEDGIMQVFDTAGDNYLGGKDLDAAIVEKIIIPYLKDNYSIDDILSDKEKSAVLRDAMKTYAEDVKNQLSFKDKEDILSNLGDLGEDDEGEEIELDLSVTQAQVFDAMRPIFQKAVDICKDLLKKNNLTSNDLNKLILVGGPTHSPLIRQMLREQVTPNVDTSIDPMTAVATGAALYASTLDNDVKAEDIEVGTIKLEVGYESTSVEQSEWVSVKLDRKASGATCPEKVTVEFVRSDNAWSSGKTEINEMGNVIEANLLEGKTNAFTINVYNSKGDQLPCFPSEITIIQGSKVGAAPLPYNIGIAVWSDNKQKAVFREAKGLEKNKPVPAVGVINGLKTTQQLRPGMESDILKVPVYQCEDEPESGRSADLYEYVADVIVTGDEIESLIPENSPVDITIKVDSSEQMTLEIYFPSEDFTVTKQLDTSKKQSNVEAEKQIPKMIKTAQRDIDRLSDSSIDTSKLQRELDAVKEDHKNSQEKKAVLQHLKEVLRKIEDEDAGTEWERLENEIREEFERLEKADSDLGDDKTHQAVNALRTQTDKIIRSKDIELGRELLKKIKGLFFHLTEIHHLMAFTEHFYNNFDSIDWKNRTRARQLVNQAAEIAETNPSVEKLKPIMRQIIEQMSNPDAGGLPQGLLR
ncbi:MAG: Hsp70 family protein [Bacteroidales bacterium]|nr:Hsp70 family protein [Bacteroidales bacterium]